MSDTETDVDDLLEESKNQSRTNTEPKSDDVDGDIPDLDDAVADALHRIEKGDLHENITLRDENLAALFAALSDTARLESIQRDAEEHTGRDAQDVSTASAARALIRVGLNEVGEDVLSDAESGRQTYVLEQESGF